MREEEKAGMKRYDKFSHGITNICYLCLQVEILEQGIEREDNGDGDNDDDEGPPDLTYFPYVGPGR